MAMILLDPRYKSNTTGKYEVVSYDSIMYVGGPIINEKNISIIFKGEKSSQWWK